MFEGHFFLFLIHIDKEIKFFLYLLFKSLVNLRESRQRKVVLGAKGNT